MARHRNIRTMNYDDELDDYASDDYGSTPLDNGCITPETEHLYMYQARERNGSISKIWEPQNLPVKEEDELETIEDEYLVDTGEIPPADQQKYYACLEQVQYVMGDTISEMKIREVAKSLNYDAERTLNQLLSQSSDKKQGVQDDGLAAILNQPFSLNDILGASAQSFTPKNDRVPMNSSLNGGLPLSADSDAVDIGALLSAENDTQNLSNLLESNALLEELLGAQTTTVNLDLKEDLACKDRKPLDDLIACPLVNVDVVPVQKTLNNSVSPLSCMLKRTSSEENSFKSILRWFLSYLKEQQKFNFQCPSPDDIFINARKGTVQRDIKKAAAEPVKQKTSEIPPMAVPSRFTFGGTDSARKVEVAPKRAEKLKEPERVETPKRLQAESSTTTVVASPKPAHVPKVKTEDILKEYQSGRCSQKSLINLVVVGHVDAGKSTLVGHLLFLSGVVQKKTMDNYEHEAKKMGKASFAFAWVLDATAEERERGITMDMSEAKFETQNRVVNILDAPGHKDFIPNMITGAAQADVAILVVNATRGEFETGFELGGQTREHTMLVRALGVSKLIVAVNKLDSCNWSQSRYDEIVRILKPFLKQTGYSDSVLFVPCSGLSGENLYKKSTIAALIDWYDGPCLVDVIDKIEPPTRAVAKPLRMSVNDVFKGQLSGNFVSGKIETGSMAVGDKLVIMPLQEPCVVKTITIDELPEKRAFAGDTVLAILDKYDPAKLSVGSVLCPPDNRIEAVTKFEAQIVIFNVETPIIKGFPIILHFQACSEQGNITKLVSKIERSTGNVLQKKPRFLLKNSTGVVEIKVTRAVCLEVYSKFRELGRITLRQNGKTVAAGVVTKILQDTAGV